MREGKRIRTRHLDVRILASPLSHLRAGVLVPRYSESAVARNRLKRRLRELIRTRLLPVSLSVDIVIRARPDTYHAAFDELAADIMRVTAVTLRSI